MKGNLSTRSVEMTEDIIHIVLQKSVISSAVRQPAGGIEKSNHFQQISPLPNPQMKGNLSARSVEMTQDIIHIVLHKKCHFECSPPTGGRNREI